MSTYLIYAGDVKVDIGVRVRTYRENELSGAPSFYNPGDGKRRFTRMRDFAAELSGQGDSAAISKRRTQVQRVVIHHDGMPTSAGCFRVLLQRNLSTHIMIDRDGTVWQPLALADIAWHSGDPHNAESVGMDLCNPVKPRRVTDASERRDRGLFTGFINGGKVTSLGYTEAQYESLLAVLSGLFKVFPRIKRQAPVDQAGKVLRNKLLNTDFSGLVGHQHISANKWDPGPGFDWERVLIGVRGNRYFFPVTLPGARNLAHVPKRQAMKYAETYFRSIEEGEGGFYPVGANQAWHSGVHLAMPAKNRDGQRTPVYAPADGTIMAAKNTPQMEKMGSPNVVVIRHNGKIRGKKKVFWSVISHLDAEARSRESKVKWIRDLLEQDGPRGLPEDDGDGLTSAEGFVALRSDLVALIEVPVKAGDIIGHVGRFAPEPDGTGMEELIDFAILSAKPLVLDGTFDLDETDDDPGLLCNSRHVWKRYTERPEELQGLIEGGYPLAPAEVRDFFASNKRAEDLRWLAPKHVTEFSDATDFGGLFGGGVDFEWDLREKAKRFKKRIRPFLWWDEAVGEHTGLPKDRLVYTWHPIALLTSLAVDEARSAFETDEAAKGFSDKEVLSEKRKDAVAEREDAEKKGTSVERNVFGTFDATDDISGAAQDVDKDGDDEFELENWMRWEQGEWPPP